MLRFYCPLYVLVIGVCFFLCGVCVFLSFNFYIKVKYNLCTIYRVNLFCICLYFTITVESMHSYAFTLLLSMFQFKNALKHFLRGKSIGDPFLTCFFEKGVISPFLKDRIAEYSILGWQYFSYFYHIISFLVKVFCREIL